MKGLVELAQRNSKIAYLYAFLGNLALAIGQTLFKMLTAYLHPFQAIFLRSFCIALINFYLMRKDQKQAYIKSPQSFIRLLSRLSVNSISFLSMLYCLGYLPISTVITIYNTGPIFIYFIEVYNYQQGFNLPNFLLTLLSFAGIVLLAQPEFIFGVSQTPKIDGYNYYVLLMLISAFCNALNFHFVHGLAKKIDSMINMHYSHLGNMFVSGFLCNFTPKAMNPLDFNSKFILLIILVAVVGIFAQNLIFLASSLKKPSLMMPFGYVGVTTGFFIDLFLFDTQFTFMSILGIFLTSLGLISGYLLQTNKKGLQKQKQPVKKGQTEQHNTQMLVSLNQQSQKNQKE